MTAFTHNVSDSAAPIGWYRVRWNASVNDGDLVLLRMPIKQVAALPGQQVTFTPKGVYVDRKLLPNSAPEPGFPHFPFGTYVVPDFMFLGMGLRDPDSWDGRYYAFLPQSIIAGTVQPVWTR